MMQDFIQWNADRIGSLNEASGASSHGHLIDVIMDVPLVFLVPALEYMSRKVKNGGVKGLDPNVANAIARQLDPSEWMVGSAKSPIEKRYNWYGSDKRNILGAFAGVVDSLPFDFVIATLNDAMSDGELLADNPKIDPEDLAFIMVPGDITSTLRSIGAEKVSIEKADTIPVPLNSEG